MVLESIPEWLTNSVYEAGILRAPVTVNCIRLKRTNIHDHISKDVDLEVLDKLIEAADYWKDTVGTNVRFFQPDGRHPNRRGHRQIYNLLKQELKN